MPTQTQAKSEKPLFNERNVKIALAQIGSTQTQLAADISRSPAAVNQAIKHNLYPGVIRLICKNLNLQYPTTA